MQLIEDVLQYTGDLIVMNDGTTDHTEEILSAVPGIVQLIKHQNIAGKGMALQSAFAHALDKGYDYAITLDSDAQHYASDLHLFLNELEQEPHSLLIGAPNMDQENRPVKTNIRSKLSNFGFWIKTGAKLKDSQSGYCLYPIRKMQEIRCMSSMKVEVIVKSAWRGISIKNIPIQLPVEPDKKSVDPFRSFRDFSRASFLHTYLITLALFYYLPLRFFRTLTRENIKNFIKKNFFDKNEPIHIKALSVAFGVFMGIFPVIGFQLLIGIPLAHLFRLNKAIFVIAAHISIPPVMPVIFFAGYKLGGLLVESPKNDILFTDGVTMETIQDNLLQFVVGSAVLAVIMGLLAGLLSYLYFFMARNRQLAVAPAPVKSV